MSRMRKYDSAKLMPTILEEMASGRTLRDVCRDEGMPDNSTVLGWVRNDEEIAKQYARARELMCEAMADEIVEIADDGTNDWMQKTVRGREVTVLNGEHVTRSKLRVDARKWLLAKAMPKVYGAAPSVQIDQSQHVHLPAEVERVIEDERFIEASLARLADGEDGGEPESNGSTNGSA